MIIGLMRRTGAVVAAVSLASMMRIMMGMDAPRMRWRWTMTI